MADKGIRPFCNAKFVELLPQRAELGNTVFRKTVMAETMDAFGCTLASAATHYNHAFKTVKAASPELVEGLGRAEDKKGGRKPKAKAEEVAAPVVPEVAPFFPFPTAASMGTDNETPAAPKPTVVWPFAEGYVAPATTGVTVYKKKDGSVFATGLTQEQADELVSKAKTAKKAALEIR